MCYSTQICSDCNDNPCTKCAEKPIINCEQCTYWTHADVYKEDVGVCQRQVRPKNIRHALEGCRFGMLPIVD